MFNDALKILSAYSAHANQKKWSDIKMIDTKNNSTKIFIKLSRLLSLTFFLLTTDRLLLSTVFAVEKVTFKTFDDVQISAEFYKPASPQMWTIVLHHGVAAVKHEWDSFAQLLSSKGYGVLVYDARGHGQSMKKSSGETVDFQYFFGQGLQSEWGRMIDDLGTAVKYLGEKQHIDPRKIAVGGASIGANVALRYAADHKEVPFVILLSPGVSYQGITTNDVIGKLVNRPMVMAGNQTDEYAYQSIMKLQSLVMDKRKDAPLTVFIEPPNSGHGVQMFRRSDPKKPSVLEDKLLRWIQHQGKK